MKILYEDCYFPVLATVTGEFIINPRDPHAAELRAIAEGINGKKRMTKRLEALFDRAFSIGGHQVFNALWDAWQLDRGQGRLYDIAAKQGRKAVRV